MGSQDYKINNIIDNRFNSIVEGDKKGTESLKEEVKEKSTIFALESIPTVRRIASLPDNLQNGNVTSALGMAGLALINLPEDMRDVKSAAKQVKAFFEGVPFEGSYNNAEFQHPFSFFRGTLLHDLANPNKCKHPKLAQKLLMADKTLFHTKFGEMIAKWLKIDITDISDTKIKSILHTEENPMFIKAYKFEGAGKFAKFGELTGRAMTRTTLIGTALIAAFELPKIIKAMSKGDGVVEKAENTAKQTAKSGLSFALTTTGIAYGGAIGSKYFKSVGSIVGMGAGAVLGALTAKLAQNAAS